MGMTIRRAATIVTGATGYVGSLVAGKLLAETDAHLVLPVRPHHSRESVLARIANEINAVRASAASDLARRVTVVPLSPAGDISQLYETLRGHTIVDLIHCAGCVEYFHSENLARGNPTLTRALASAGWSACTSVITLATQQIGRQLGDGERVFQAFCGAADGVLKRLDSLGEGVDHLFGQRFGLTFSELLGELTAELLPACVALGVNRRKLVCHLAGVFMGL